MKEQHLPSLMHEGTAVALFREGKTTVKSIFCLMQIKLDNYVVLFLAIWPLPVEKNVSQACCNKP